MMFGAKDVVVYHKDAREVAAHLMLIGEATIEVTIDSYVVHFRGKRAGSLSSFNEAVDYMASLIRREMN